MRGIRVQFFRESVAEMSRIRYDIRFGGVPNPPRGHSDDAPRADFGHIEFICEKFPTSC